MAIDRSIRVTIYTSIADEDQNKLLRRLMAYGDPAGTCATTMGSYAAGSRANNLLIAIGSGSVELSYRCDVDAAVSVTSFLTLMANIIRACMTCSTTLAMTTAAYSAGSGSTDSVLQTVT